MKSYFTFMDEKIQYLKISDLSRITYKFNAIPVNISREYLWNLIN